MGSPKVPLRAGPCICPSDRTTQPSSGQRSSSQSGAARSPTSRSRIRMVSTETQRLLVPQAGIDEGLRRGVRATGKAEKFRRLRREARTFRGDREILPKAQAVSEWVPSALQALPFDVPCASCAPGRARAGSAPVCCAGPDRPRCRARGDQSRAARRSPSRSG
jgi:hypothetical protein